MRWLRAFGWLPVPVFYTDWAIPEGSQGFTPGPMIFISPDCRADCGLLAHELVHVRQFWRTGGLFVPLYLCSRTWRLRCEVEAYREQLRHYADDRRELFAGFLAGKYRLGISVEEARALLSA